MWIKPGWPKYIARGYQKSYTRTMGLVDSNVTTNVYWSNSAGLLHFAINLTRIQKSPAIMVLSPNSPRGCSIPMFAGSYVHLEVSKVVGVPHFIILFFDFSLTTIHFGDPPYVIRHRNSHIDPSWIFEATKSKNNYSTMDSSPDNLVIIKVVATLPPQLLCVYLRSWCYTSLCLFFRL